MPTTLPLPCAHCLETVGASTSLSSNSCYFFSNVEFMNVSKVALCASPLQETEDTAQVFVSSTVEEKNCSDLPPGEALRLPPVPIEYEAEQVPEPG